MSQSHEIDFRLDQPVVRRVLVVQNEPTLRLGFSYALTNASTVIETASTGPETLNQLENTDFDLILLELRMPEMDGIDVIEKLRARNDETRVILCTSMQHPNATLRAIRLGVVDYLIKPVRPDEVRRAVDFILNPGSDPFSQAMEAARRRELDEAIHLLRGIQQPFPWEQDWLNVLLLIHGSPSCDDNTGLDERVRASFPFIAFNASDRL